MLTHEQLRAQALAKAEVKAEHEKLNADDALLDEFLKARAAQGLTPAQQALIFAENTRQDPFSLPVPVPSLQRAIVLGALLILLDALMLNQGGIAIFVALALLFIHLPRTFLAKKYVSVRRERLRNMAVYFAAVILVFVLNAANNHMAQTRGDALVVAIKAFHAQHQRYPESLEELVPKFIEEIPLAKYTLIFNWFSYRILTLDVPPNSGYKPSHKFVSLFYFDAPPFATQSYSFEKNEWGYLD